MYTLVIFYPIKVLVDFLYHIKTESPVPLELHNMVTIVKQLASRVAVLCKTFAAGHCVTSVIVFAFPFGA